MKVKLVYRGLSSKGADNMIVWNLPCCDIFKFDFTWK